MTAVGGALVLGLPGERAFVRADILRQVVQSPFVSRIPGAPLGMALIAGQVVAVLELGEPTSSLLVCDIAGEAVAFSGLQVERVGFFRSEGAYVHVDDALVPELRLDRLIERGALPYGAPP